MLPDVADYCKQVEPHMVYGMKVISGKEKAGFIGWVFC